MIRWPTGGSVGVPRRCGPGFAQLSFELAGGYVQHREIGLALRGGDQDGRLGGASRSPAGPGGGRGGGKT